MTVILFRIIFFAIIACLAGAPFTSAVAASRPSRVQEVHFCGETGFELDEPQYDQSTNRRNARSFAPNPNVGEPRTVRMVYFLPNDRPYRAEVVQRMKDEITNIRTFYAEKMNGAGYGDQTFRVEPDAQGVPKVHRVNGQFADGYYEGEGDRVNNQGVLDEVNQLFNLNSNIFLIIADISAGRLRGGGNRLGKSGGFALLTSDYFWAIAHELGHAFGLQHDFGDSAYIMSYGWGARGTVGRLSQCNARYLSVHPYFNPNTPIDEGEGNSIIDIISPRTYPEGSQSVPVHIKVSDSRGLYQVLLFVDTREPHRAAGFREVKACRGLAGDRETVVEFDYDGVIPSDGLTNLSNPASHRIHVNTVDTDGNVTPASFGLAEISRDRDGVDEIDIPDPNLRVVIAEAIGLPLNAPIQRAHLETLIELEAKNANINNLTGLGAAINLKTLNLGGEFVVAEARVINSNSVSNLSPLRGLEIESLNLEYNSNISDISVVSGMTELTRLRLSQNSISDISAVTGLPNLTLLTLDNNSISDISAVTGLTNLKWLYLGSNNISNISALSNLTNLTWLILNDNIVSDISAVARLNRLERLYLSSNSISDISAVAGLIELQGLYLGNNSISDISTVADLTNLRSLNLKNNSVSDISPLLENAGFGSGAAVNLSVNPLSYQSIHTHIPTLQEREVAISYDKRSPNSIRIVSGNEQRGLPSNKLSFPFVVEVLDGSRSPYEGVMVTFTITEGRGTLSATSVTTDHNGRAESLLTLGPNPESNIVTVSATGVEKVQTITAEGIRIP